MKNKILIILLTLIANLCFSQNQPDTTYEYRFSNNSPTDSTLFYKNIYHYDLDGKIKNIENINKQFYWCSGNYSIKAGNYVTYYEYDDSNQIKCIFMLDKNNDTVCKQIFTLINNDLEYLYRIKSNGKLVNYYRYYFYNIKNRLSTSLLNEALNQLNVYSTYSYYHCDSIYIEMFDTLSSQYDVYSKIYFTYLSNNLVQRCIQNTKTVSCTLDLSYDSDLRCNGIECTKSIIDSCSDKYWYLSETLNENKKLSEILIIPYFSNCFKKFMYNERKENYYYDENNNLISVKVFDKDSLDNWDIYVSKYYKYNSLNINDINKQIISLFPNPASNQITLDNGNCLIKTVYMYDVTGREVKRFYINMNKITLDISDVQNGMYVVKINTEQGVTTKKIQIIR